MRGLAKNILYSSSNARLGYLPSSISFNAVCVMRLTGSCTRMIKFRKLQNISDMRISIPSPKHLKNIMTSLRQSFEKITYIDAISMPAPPPPPPMSPAGKDIFPDPDPGFFPCNSRHNQGRFLSCRPPLPNKNSSYYENTG